MTTSQHVARRLRTLCRLEREPESFRRTLTAGERRQTIGILRRLLPLAVLGHHDRLLQRGRASIAAVTAPVCPACHLKLNRGQWQRLRRARDLELCDHCGIFLYHDETAACENPLL